MRAAARLALLVTLAASAPPLARAQQLGDEGLEHVAWPLVDFLVFGDSARGVEVLLSPNLKSLQGDGLHDVIIRLDAVSARRWAFAAIHVVDSVARLDRGDRHPWAVQPLRGWGGSKTMVIGMDGQEPEGEPFRFVIADSAAPQRTMRVTATADQVRDLLTVIDGVAQNDLVAARPQDGADISEGPVEPPRLLDRAVARRPEAINRGAVGRVLAVFVVDTTGRVDSASIRVLMTDGDVFSTAARAAIVAQSFAPARSAGRPVRMRVSQWMNFNGGSRFPNPIIIE